MLSACTNHKDVAAQEAKIYQTIQQEELNHKREQVIQRLLEWSFTPYVLSRIEIVETKNDGTQLARLHLVNRMKVIYKYVHFYIPEEFNHVKIIGFYNAKSNR